ncbi:MAG: DUF721 domain-containing protein [Thermoleophilaceae bacterium]
MRRLAPRRLDAALRQVTGDAAPATALARVQGCWREAMGEQLAAEAQPVSERGGTVTVACRTATWAQELELLEDDLTKRLNAALGGGEGEVSVRALRFVVGDSEASSARRSARSAGSPRRRPRR